VHREVGEGLPGRLVAVDIHGVHGAQGGLVPD
jgi:hypothetical protein